MLTARNALAVTLRILSLAVVVLSTKIFATILPEVSFGELSLYNVMITLPSTAFFGPISQGIIRFVPVANQENEVEKVMVVFDKYFLIGTCAIGSGAILLAMIYAATFGSLNWLACSLVLLLAIATSYNALHYGLRNVEGRRVESMALELLERCTFLILATSFLLSVINSVTSVLVAQSIVVLGIAIYLFKQDSQKRRIRVFGNTDSSNGMNTYEKKVLAYSWPFLVFGTVAWLQTASERWVIEIFLSTESVADFAIVNQIGFQSLSLLLGVIGFFVTPALFRRAGANTSSEIKESNKLNNQYLGFIMAVTGIGVLVAFIVAPAIIRILADEKYVHTSWLLPWMILAGGIFNLAQGYANRFMLNLRTDLIIFPRVASGVIGLVLNIVFIQWIGMPGLVIAMIITYACYGALLILNWELSTRFSRNQAASIS